MNFIFFKEAKIQHENLNQHFVSPYCNKATENCEPNNVGGFYVCAQKQHFYYNYQINPSSTKDPSLYSTKSSKLFTQFNNPFAGNFNSRWDSGEKMEVESEKPGSDGKVWNFCRMPFWQTSNNPSSSSTTTSSSSTSYMHNVHHQSQSIHSVDRSVPQSSATVSSVAKSLLPTRRRLRLDPPNKLYFPCMCFFKLVFLFLFWFFFSCVYLFID